TSVAKNIISDAGGRRFAAKKRRPNTEVTENRARRTQRRGRARLGCALLNCGETRSVRGGRGRLVFVGAGTIKPRDGDIQQAEIDTELGAMVDQVVHHHATNAGYAGH